MATLMNPFDLLGNEGVEDPMLLIQSLPLKVSADSASKKPGQARQPPPAAPAKLPSKPLPPSQAVREAKNEGNRGGSRGGYGGGRGGYGGGRGGSRGYGRDAGNEVNSFSSTITPSSQGGPDGGEAFKSSERRSYNGPRGDSGPRGGYRGGYRNEEGGDGERQRRPYERRSGTGRGNEFKREGSGRGNWGTQEDEITPVTEAIGETEKHVSDEKPAENEDVVTESIKEVPPAEAEEKEPEDKSMTLEEYEKVLEEKRKALQTLKSEERKVDAKEFESMQQLSNKKDNNDIFVKLGSEKDKKKEAYEKEEKAKKSVSINEFLKPAEGERYYSPGGRGRGRGRGGRGSYSGGDQRATGNAPSPDSPSIADPKQFPTLGGK